jgi:hypothetical protein
MNKEFIPYELALEIKELGFNEECVATYRHDGDFNIVEQNGLSWNIKTNPNVHCAAPLYQQAFRWFREKGYRFTLSSDYENGIYYFDVWKSNQFMFETDYIYNTYEEAELECLKKLIEIAKNK